MSDYTLNLTPQLYDYYKKISIREPNILRDLRNQTNKMSMSQMQVSPEQGQFMGMLVKLMKAKKTLEIGTFTGYSALAVALALPSDGKVVCCDINSEWTRIAKKYWELAQVSNRIELHLAPALETLEVLLKTEALSFDFIFIDADKINYDAYYEMALKLLRPGGLVAVDNVLWSGYVADLTIQDTNTNAIRAFNEKLLNDSRVSISMIPIGDGLTLALKEG